MAEEEGAPRKTTTYGQFSGMNSQDERYGCENDEFFWLENIMRVGDGKLQSIRGPGPTIGTFPFSVPCRLLLEDGFILLTEDGAFFDLESCAGTAPDTFGDLLKEDGSALLFEDLFKIRLEQF